MTQEIQAPVVQIRLGNWLVREVVHEGTVYWDVNDILTILNPPDALRESVAVATLEGSQVGVDDREYVDETCIQAMMAASMSQANRFLRARMRERKMYTKQKKTRPLVNSDILELKAQLAELDAKISELNAQRAGIVAKLARLKASK